MISWLKSWFVKPKEEVQVQYPKQIVYPRGHYVLTPVKILEWWHQEPKLDPLPPFPESPRSSKPVKAQYSTLPHYSTPHQKEDPQKKLEHS